MSDTLEVKIVEFLNKEVGLKTQSLQNRIYELESHNNSWKHDVVGLQKEIEVKDDIINELESKVELYKNNIQSYEKTIVKQRESTELAHKERDKAIQERDAGVLYSKGLEAKVQDLTDNGRFLEGEIVGLRSQLTELKFNKVPVDPFEEWWKKYLEEARPESMHHKIVAKKVYDLGRRNA